MKTNYILRLKFLFIILTSLMCTYCTGSADKLPTSDLLKVSFEGDAKIEVGGPFVGIEMHHSSPLLQRISFFYPVANSLDESTDYWKRDTSFIMQLGLKIGGGEKEIVGLEPFEFDLTPYSVDFYKSDSDKSIGISYRFTKTKPAMVICYEIKNERGEETSFEFYTGLETAVRTSHSYNFIDKAWTEYDEKNSAIYTNFDDPQTQSAQIFVVNVGEKPSSFSTVSQLSGLMNPDNEWWEQNKTDLQNDLMTKDNAGRPAAKFIYRKILKPLETMTIIQVVGSCKQEEGKEIVSYLAQNYENEIDSYEQSVLKKAFGETEFASGDSIIDQSVFWARSILEANTHYLDGEFVPMPCPAEYNFYFTHDVLKTDLAAVNFDIKRVRRDLDYIIRHANEDKIIPHAYYWKDSVYQTEFADHDNWNNFWIIIVSGSYLRHSGDIAFLKTLYPYIQKSLEQALITKGDDDLMWSNMPDWWDIGEVYGSRSYMTILAVKAIREYLFISTVLESNLENLSDYEKLANRMQQQLNAKLWDDKLKYLINYYEPGKIDEHYYIGSLLAAHYGLIDKKRVEELIGTAKEKLLDEKVGIYNVFPMDFHELANYLKFVGNEAGDQFLYANGGIWPHGNAWYALALIADQQKYESFKFIKNVMSLGGIMNGPNGQPAMYEVRNGNFNDPSVYGTVDKPQFLWAAGWYLYCLYHLYGINENSWNVSFNPYLSTGQIRSSFGLFSGGNLLNIDVTGKGNYIKSIKYNGTDCPSAVIPADIMQTSDIKIELGNPEKPYLHQTNSVLMSAQLWENTLNLKFHAFKGHNNISKIISPTKPKLVRLNGSDEIKDYTVEAADKHYEIVITFFQHSEEDDIIVEFE